MKVSRDYDCSLVFDFTPEECRDIDHEMFLYADVDQLRWNELSKHFFSLARQHDTEGDFILIEDFDRDGLTIGYTALRKIPLMGKKEELGEAPFPTFAPDFEECEFPALPLKRNQGQSSSHHPSAA